MDEALKQLVEASLVTFSFDEQKVIMHRFTQRVIRECTSLLTLILFQISRFIGKRCNLGESNWEQRAATEHLIQQISSIWDNVGITSEADIDRIVQGARCKVFG
jgi:hypothetical protein